MDKNNIKTTDWLTRGMTEEQIAREKEEIIMATDLELCMFFDIWAERETGEKTVDYDYVAEKMYDIGYRKATDVAKEIFEKLYANIKFDGHTVSVWKNDLIEAAKEYGISLE